MRRIGLSVVSAMVLMSAASVGANANALENIISNPKVNLEIRPRYEYANVKNNGAKTAKAFTVRTALGFNTQLFGIDGLGAQLQMINVANFGWIDKYAPERSGYDIVADGSQTRVTQANISYTNKELGLTAIAGRKMVVLDNARFIGNVGWRQMPQTYDLYALVYSGIPNLNLLGAYVTRVHRIFNSDSNPNPFKRTEFDTGSVLLHASYKFMPELTVTAYDYMIENLMDHIGIRLTGQVNVNDVKFKYAAEYAKQDDPSLDDKDDPGYSATRKQDSDYYNVNIAAMYNGFIGGLGYEVLGDKGNGDMPFSTPLATLHAMNGWADVFLATPNEGLKDFTVKLGYNFGAYGKLIGIYHDFKSDKKNSAGDDDLGSEIDVAYKYKVNKNLGLLLKYADYNKGDNSFGKKDTTKYWIQLDYKFSASL